MSGRYRVGNADEVGGFSYRLAVAIAVPADPIARLHKRGYRERLYIANRIW